MPRKKMRPTFDQHVEIGRELFEIRNRLQELGVELSNTYPKADSKSRRLFAAVKDIDAARSLLDGALAGEYPEQFSPKIYYGRPVD